LNPREYPTLKDQGLVTIKRSGKREEVIIKIDRGEEEAHEVPDEYCEQLEAQIKDLQLEIDARTLLITDIKEAK
jgi:hypothetical protein